MMLRDKLHTKNNENTRFFLVQSLQTMFYTHVLKVYIYFQHKKTFNKITKINDIIPLKNTILLRTHSRADTGTLTHLNTTNLIRYNNKTLIYFLLYIG